MYLENGYKPPSKKKNKKKGKKKGNKEKSKTSEMDNHFVIAQWHPDIWKLFEKIVSGKVNDTGKNAGGFVIPKAITNFRQLTGKLSHQEHIMLLSEVIDGISTMKEMGDKANRIRKIKKVQLFIAYDLKVETWDQVKRKYPNVGTAEQVHQWMGTSNSLEKSTNRRPTGWTKWIRQIQKFKQTQEEVMSSAIKKVFQFQGCSYTFHCNDVVNSFSLLGQPPDQYGKFFN